MPFFVGGLGVRNTSFPCEEGIFMSFEPRQISVTAKPRLVRPRRRLDPEALVSPQAPDLLAVGGPSPPF